jgi:CelD/BcsL family acetyltransferase involved in cellulose biosynthesis
MPPATALKTAEPVDKQGLSLRDDVEELILSTTTDMDAIRASWINLEHRAAGHVFQSWAWVSQWHTHVGRARNIEPFVVMASRRDGSLAALLPFGIETSRGLRILVWLGDEHADYKGPLIDRSLLQRMTRDVVETLFDAAIRMAPGIDLVRLLEMPVTLDAGDHPLLCYKHFMSPMASHSVALGTDFDSFFKERRGTSSRKKLRQKARRLTAAHGDTRMEIAGTKSQRSRMIAALVEQKRSRLSEMGVDDVFEAAEVRAFYRSLAENHPDICQISAFMAGDTITAANWGLVWGDRYYYVLSTMADGEMRAFSPGQLHLNDLIAWSIDKGLKTFDFTAGDEAYKDDWCDTVMPLFDVHIGLTTRGRAAAYLLSAGRRIKRYIKQHAPLWELAKTVRKRLFSLREQTPW